MKVEIIKNGEEIIVNGVKCPVVHERAKNNTYLDINKLGFESWQKHIGLQFLVEGKQEFELKPRSNKGAHGKYTLTPEEEQEIAKLNARIDEIIEAAKARYVKPIKFNKIKDVSKLTAEQKLSAIEQAEALIAKLRV